jgi:signal transduction histidine kinase/ActR/RegA family two-component response regulator
MADGGRKIEPLRPASEPVVRAAEPHDVLQADGLRPVLLGTSILFLGSFIFDLLDIPAHAVVPVTLYGLLSGAVCLLVWLALGRQLIGRRWGHPVVAALGWLIASNGLLAALLTDDAGSTVYLPIVLIATGSFMLSYRWLALMCSVIFAVWTVVAYFAGSPPELSHHALVMAAAVVVAVGIVSARRASIRRLAASRRQQERLKQESEAALERAERELAERRSAEADRQKLEERLRHAQKMQAVGALAGGVAHDMNNVLTVITTLSSALKDDPSCDAAVREDAAEILAAAKRGAALTRNLLGFARRGKFRTEVFSLNEIVKRAEQLLNIAIPKRIAIVSETEAVPAEIQGDPQQISEVLVNLCLNGAEAIREAGTLTIRTRTVALTGADLSEHPDRPTGDYVELCVVDTGDGMDSETLDRAFEPLFTTKPRGAGTGLGLSMVYGVVETHGGIVRLDSEVGCGTTATVLLPVVTGAGAPTVERPVSSVEPQSARGSATIIIVDDERGVRWVSERVLTECGYRVIGVGDGDRAIDEYRIRGRAIDLVILDMAMPGMSGAECFTKLRSLDPSARILVSSGFATDGDTEKLLATGAIGFLQKPYSADQLTEAVTAALHAME